MLPALAGNALGKGIQVRFLASPPEDSIVRYTVYRSETPDGPAVSLGDLAAVAGSDTLGFPDAGALVRGKPYYYSIRAVNAAGLESDPSTQTVVAFPLLSLPDTLRPDPATKLTRITVAAGADPLQGTAPLSISLIDSTRFQLSYDAAARLAWFRSRSGKADTVRLVVRAEYFGKFEDRDTILVMAAAAGSASLERESRAPGLGGAIPTYFSPATQGAMTLLDLPGPGSLEILSARGAMVFKQSWTAPQSRFLWDGRGRDGMPLQPARYILVVRSYGGLVHKRGLFYLSR